MQHPQTGIENHEDSIIWFLSNQRACETVISHCGEVEARRFLSDGLDTENMQATIPRYMTDSGNPSGMGGALGRADNETRTRDRHKGWLTFPSVMYGTMVANPPVLHGAHSQWVEQVLASQARPRANLAYLVWRQVEYGIS